MDIESKYGAKSTFFFLLSTKMLEVEGCRIEGIKKKLRSITDAGWEIGLHGGHDTYLDVNKMSAGKKRLENVIGKEIVGYRNHYLRFKVPTTWELLKKAGFKYDTTFGYADCAGFRNGMCYPFKPFNLNTNEYVDIWEIPLIVMDTSLFEYMKLDMNSAWCIVRSLVDITEKLHGVMTVLWHNPSMVGARGELYEGLLQYCHARGAWMTSAETIWKNSVKTCLDKNNIENPAIQFLTV